MTAISDRTPAVTVEYDARGKRATKHFEDANDAKRFYAAKDKAGRNPTVTGEQAAADTAPADEETQELTDAVNAAIEANPAPATIKIPGVAANARTRAYFAGVVIAAHGHAAGVTDAMIAEVDELFGRPNPTESGILLRNLWHGMRGAGVAAGLAPTTAPSTAAANA